MLVIFYTKQLLLLHCKCRIHVQSVKRLSQNAISYVIIYVVQCTVQIHVQTKIRVIIVLVSPIFPPLDNFGRRF